MPEPIRNFLWVLLIVAVSYAAADLAAETARLGLSPEPVPIRARAARPQRDQMSTHRAGRQISQALSYSPPPAQEPPPWVDPAPPTPAPAPTPLAPRTTAGTGDLAFALKGVVAGGEVRLAVFEKQGETFLIREGESFQGYRVERVDPLSVTLDDGQEKTLMELQAAGR